MRRIGLLLLSASIVSGCAGIGANESVSVLIQKSAGPAANLTPYEKGKQYLQLKQYGLAVAAFQQEIQENPDSVRALNGLAIAYDQLGRQDVAQKLLDRALNVDPDSAVTLNNLAYLNLLEGNTAVALAYSERARTAVRVTSDMPVAPAIAEAVSQNAAIAADVAANDADAMLPALIGNLPEENSNVRRVGLNEWELRLPASQSVEGVGTVHNRVPPQPEAAVLVQTPSSDAGLAKEAAVESSTATTADIQPASPSGSVPNVREAAAPIASRDIGPYPVSIQTLVDRKNVQVASAVPLTNPVIPDTEASKPAMATADRQVPAPHPVAPSASSGNEWFAQAPSGTKIRVSNGAGRRLMATRFSHYLGEHGVSVGRISNASSFNYKATVIFYNPDQQEFACELAKLLPFQTKLMEAKRGRGWIEVVLGADLLSFDGTLPPAKAL